MLIITYKDGEAITYDEDKYTDYSYDSRCFIVIRGQRWIGIYNMDCVSSIEFREVPEE